MPLKNPIKALKGLTHSNPGILFKMILFILDNQISARETYKFQNTRNHSLKRKHNFHHLLFFYLKTEIKHLIQKILSKNKTFQKIWCNNAHLNKSIVFSQILSLKMILKFF